MTTEPSREELKKMAEHIIQDCTRGPGCPICEVAQALLNAYKREEKWEKISTDMMELALTLNAQVRNRDALIQIGETHTILTALLQRKDSK